MKIVTTLKTFDLSFNSQESISPDPKDIGRVHINFQPTEIVSSLIPLIKEVVLKASPYTATVYFHSKSKDIEIQEMYFLMDNQRVEIENEILFKKKVDDIFIFQSKETLLKVNVESLKKLTFVAHYTVDEKEAEVKHIYTVYYTEETGNRLWWSIMSV